ncbi:TMEM165/GDT1 family protein [Phycicoccus elongatus]|uniref:TMEM165/GDT1 family protein n=1 Tax=Phycicoccus elongatus TaxID=101689 RepID=UPI002D1F9BF0|nr:TMEM165/GDT1 family protein [Phycicoccus elongatus]MCB9406602.1 TMEM165/GDT1 family protein [Tetrasphaera sp.]
MLDLTTMALVFGAIFLVELPDKTFIATLVMSTRFRPLLVWIGVGLAFLVQTLVAVVAGGLLAKLPTTPVQLVAIAMFLIGGVILLKGAAGADAEEAETEEEFAEKSNRQVRGWQIVSMCFGIIFLAEWGDLSQLLTASMVLKYGEPVSVFLGAWAALLAVSALGAALGRTLLTKMKLSTIRRIGGVVCLVLALVGILELTGVFGG